MASDLQVKEVNGINLENYYPSKRSYNSVVYVHKKFFDDHKDTVAANDNYENVDNANSRKTTQKKKSKHNTFKHKKINEIEKEVDQTSVYNDEVLGQTIRFAKNIVPIVIPPSGNDMSQVYYTIKTSRKSRARKKSKDFAVPQDTTTYRKQQENKIIETFHKENYNCHTESCSRESISRSSVENIIISQSLNSSTTEISERRVRKTLRSDKRCNKSNVAASESLEALATEVLHTSGVAKIKIHLMDDTAKDLFYESIRKPVLDAIKESVSEMMHSKEHAESKSVKKYVQCHTQKLDKILDKLTCIEKRLDAEKTKIRRVKNKPSALEEIGEDIMEEEEDLEDDGVAYNAIEKPKTRNTSAVVRLSPLQKTEEMQPCSGDGEDIISHKAVALSLARPDKIPTRYCWTDSHQ